MIRIKKTTISPKDPTIFSDVEYKLIPRLTCMGYIFSCLSLISLIFAFFVHADKTPLAPLIIDEKNILADIQEISDTALLTEMHSLEVSAEDILNFYVVSLIFASIGTSIFFIASKKKKTFELISRTLVK